MEYWSDGRMVKDELRKESLQSSVRNSEYVQWQTLYAMLYALCV